MKYEWNFPNQCYVCVLQVLKVLVLGMFWVNPKHSSAKMIARLSALQVASTMPLPWTSKVCTQIFILIYSHPYFMLIWYIRGSRYKLCFLLYPINNDIYYLLLSFQQLLATTSNHSTTTINICHQLHPQETYPFNNSLRLYSLYWSSWLRSSRTRKY